MLREGTTAAMVGNGNLAVVAGDILVLRGTVGLAAPETWALLCQAAQALQDLFLSNGGVIGRSTIGPVVTPYTLELTHCGRVKLQMASPETARAYLPPEYRPGHVYSDTDSEKMWMYSLGRALLDTTPRVAALTGSVSVSPASALQSVLSAMTEPDPRRRASLMNLLDIISEYCRTRLQSKPFTRIIMDMYQQVIRSPRYGAKREACFPDTFRGVIPDCDTRRHRRHEKNNNNNNNQQQQQQQQRTIHSSNKHQVKGALFKAQSCNSQSHPNLVSLSTREPSSLSHRKPQFQSQMDIIEMADMQHHQRVPRTQQQAAGAAAAAAAAVAAEQYSTRRGAQRAHDLIGFSSGHRQPPPAAADYAESIYGLLLPPVKPFLSSQDVRVNGLSAKESSIGVHGALRNIKSNGSSETITRAFKSQVELRNSKDIGTGQSFNWPFSNTASSTTRIDDPVYYYTRRTNDDQATSTFSNAPDNNNILDNKTIDGDDKKITCTRTAEQRSCPRGPVPPKPPRLMVTNNDPNRLAPPRLSVEANNGGASEPPRTTITNNAGGPRVGARRGRRKPVQRAISRLYRTIGGPTRNFDKTQCVGPEFFVRANQPPKILCMSDPKLASNDVNNARVVVILLTGERIRVSCEPQKITAGQLFQAIVQAENLEENFNLGLAALLGGDFAMLPMDTKLNKVAPPGWMNSNTKNKETTLGLATSFVLYLRFRFFLPSIRGIRSWISKHLLYLQLRRCILEQQLVCTLGQLIDLTGLALQAEFGNYSADEHGRGNYFLLEHYIPESLILNPDVQLSIPDSAEALRAKLHQAHRERRGLDSNSAEERFITHAQSLADYGSHYYIAAVDDKQLERIVARLNKNEQANSGPALLPAAPTQNTYNRIDDSCDNEAVDRSPLYTDPQNRKIRVPMLPRVSTAMSEHDIYGTISTPNHHSNNVNDENKKNSNSSDTKSKSKTNLKKSERSVWLAIHPQGLKLLERSTESRPKVGVELVRLLWRDIQTLSYSKNSLVVFIKLNGKSCKFKLRMDHKKSYYAFKLTSLHHQFYLKLRSDRAALDDLVKEFGTSVTVDSPTNMKNLDSKITEEIKVPVSTVNNRGKISNSKYPMQLEEYQNKENENPRKPSDEAEVVCYTPEEQQDDALYARVNARLEPEGASRDTEDESDRAGPIITGNPNGRTSLERISQSHHQRLSQENNKLYDYPRIISSLPSSDKESLYSIPKLPPPVTLNSIDRFHTSSQATLKLPDPEQLYAAIDKSVQRNDNVTNNTNAEYSVISETWNAANFKANLHNKVKSMSSLGNEQMQQPSSSLPRRLGVKMGTRAIYSSLVQRDSALITDDLSSLESMHGTVPPAVIVQSSNEQQSPYVLNADIRTDEETFRIENDDTMSSSLAAMLEELSFVEERSLRVIELKRGHGGSIGLQVTEGNDGSVYVQAVSVGGSADMAGNVNKGDRIVAINGQSLLNLPYEESLKMLQSSSESVQLVLSQTTSNEMGHQNPNIRPIDDSYLRNLKFDISSEPIGTSDLTTKWLSDEPAEAIAASVATTSSTASSSPASSEIGSNNHYTKHLYTMDTDTDVNVLNSASMLLSLEDFDVSRTSRQVFI